MVEGKRYIAILIVLFIANCSTFYGGTTSSTGDQSISAAQTEVQISGDVGTTSYRTIQFANRTSSETYEINNMAFVGNDCGAYSVYNILDANQTMVYQTGDDVAITLAPGETIDVNIQFSPISCEVTEYTTTFIIYFVSGEANYSASVSLVTSVNDTAPEEAVCVEEDITYYDEYENPTERTLPALSAGETYYLKVNKLNAYLKNTGAFATYSFVVSTHINLDIIPEDEWFEPVYLPIEVDGEGNASLVAFDECKQFYVPTAITDTFFLGSDLVITLKSNSTGSIDRNENPGRLVLTDLSFSISSYINNSNSLIQDESGYFTVFLDLESLTTEEVENEYINEIPNETDDFGDALYNIEDNTLLGKDIRHGTITLVGIALFSDDSETKMSSEAYSALVDNEAYFFLLLEGEITQAVQ